MEEREKKREEENKAVEEEKKNAFVKFLMKRVEIIKYTIKLIRDNGLSSLYNGISSSIFGSIVQYAIYFCSSKFWSYVLDYFEIKLGGLGRTMLINLISAICTAIVTNPIWVINARMVNKKKEVII